MSKEEPKPFIVNPADLPEGFPTHQHTGEFWEALGRVVGTFGFLEEVLGKAIFAFSGTRRIPDEQIGAQFEKWLSTLERALSDPLGGLIDTYGKAVRTHGAAVITPYDLEILLGQLRDSSGIRNVLCHGSWRSIPDKNGRSVPFFVDKKGMVFTTPVDVAFLQQMQRHVVDLACAVMNTVTQMGWQFPGSKGPGNPVFSTSKS
jgi:hypothetical protein